MKNDVKYITCEINGTLVKYEVLFSFYSKLSGKDYVIYTDNTMDGDKKNIFASIYIPKEENKIVDITLDSDWEIVEDFLFENDDDNHE